MYKQVIIVRKDLNMRKGKMAAQVAHAAMMFICERMQANPNLDDSFTMEMKISKEEKNWLSGQFKKVCLGVNSEEAMRDLHERAKAAGLQSYIVEDTGLTEFGGKLTNTCLAIGPDLEEKVNAITGHLPLNL